MNHVFQLQFSVLPLIYYIIQLDVDQLLLKILSSSTQASSQNLNMVIFIFID